MHNDILCQYDESNNQIVVPKVVSCVNKTQISIITKAHQFENFKTQKLESCVYTNNCSYLIYGKWTRKFPKIALYAYLLTKILLTRENAVYNT